MMTLRHARLSKLVTLVVLSALFFAANYHFHQRFPTGLPSIYTVMYLPTGPALNFVSAGYANIIADVIYLWAIQYYANYAISERYTYLRRIFDLITDLDPHYTDAYRLASLICSVELRQVKGCALYFLDRGLATNPHFYPLATDAAFYCWFYDHDRECTLRYLKKAAAIPGAPLYIRRWMAKIEALEGNLDIAITMWRDLAANGNKYTRSLAENYIHDLTILKVAFDIRTWVNKYVAITGEQPKRLTDLRRIGYQGPLVDRYQRPFHYDPKTGKVTPDPQSLVFGDKIMKQFAF